MTSVPSEQAGQPGAAAGTERLTASELATNRGDFLKRLFAVVVSAGFANQLIAMGVDKATHLALGDRRSASCCFLRLGAWLLKMRRAILVASFIAIPLVCSAQAPCDLELVHQTDPKDNDRYT